MEDIALDKRIAAQKAANERSYKESGIVSSLPPEMPVPRFDINELTDMIFNTVYVYMEENPDRFPAPDEYELLIRQSFDPRIHALLYGETKAGLLSGFENGNPVAWDVKQSDGGYTILILARDAAGGKWRVLTEGDVYKLRRELTD